MYTGPLKTAFFPDESHFRHAEERERIAMQLRQEAEPFSPPPFAEEESKAPHGLSKLLEMVSPEDSALIALIVFLLCDNTDNDVVLLGILLYVLLSKG